MVEMKIVGRGVDTIVLNVCYADKQFQPIKQELDADLQEKLNSLQGEARINESPVVTEWAFKEFNLFLKQHRTWLLKEAGLPHVRFHDLRHSAAALLRGMGVDMKVIQEILGHSNFMITANIYSHVFLSEQERAMGKGDSEFKPDTKDDEQAR